MISRKIISTQRKIVDSNFGAGKTISISIRGGGLTTGIVYSALRLIVDDEAKTLQELVLMEKINPAVLIYTCSSSTSYLMKSPLSLYTGGSTASSNFSDVAILVGLKTGCVYSGIELTASKATNTTYDGLDLYLWDGVFYTTMSSNIYTLDALNQQTAAYTWDNIESNMEIELGVIPKPGAIAKYYDGNSLIRVNYHGDTDDKGFCEVFHLYYKDGQGLFLGAPDYYTTHASPAPRIWILSGKNRYPFISSVHFVK